MIDRFTHLKYISKETKFIIRGKLKNVIIAGSHIALNTNYCNSKGEQIHPKYFNEMPKENNSIAYIKHFFTKTAEEYCIKRKRGYAQTSSKQNVKLNEEEINIFFSINKKTFEKIKILERCNNLA